jgi:hypothetical protein
LLAAAGYAGDAWCACCLVSLLTRCNLARLVVELRQVRQLLACQSAGHGRQAAQGVRYSHWHSVRHCKPQVWSRGRRDHDQVSASTPAASARINLHVSTARQLCPSARPSCGLPHRVTTSFARSATATGGTVLLEFGLLSRASGFRALLPVRKPRVACTSTQFVHWLSPHLTLRGAGDARYAAAADRAAKALWKRRSQVTS